MCIDSKISITVNSRELELQYELTYTANGKLNLVNITWYSQIILQIITLLLFFLFYFLVLGKISRTF